MKIPEKFENKKYITINLDENCSGEEFAMVYGMVKPTHDLYSTIFNDEFNLMVKSYYEMQELLNATGV